ncbi:hypothetical protein [Risungbinella massiliensis]|uniref:hypothetical protein n=1 Tax=Risungbinella massiliensis TaxID=1329796 RepID=UPI0005CC78E2|nr:hypothetical protein [Risungbinella massiliensis]
MRKEQSKFYQVFSKSEPLLIVHYVEMQLQANLFRKIHDLGEHLLIYTENQEEPNQLWMGEAIYLEREKIGELEDWLNERDYETVESYPFPKGILIIYYTMKPFFPLRLQESAPSIDSFDVEEERPSKFPMVAMSFLSILFFILWLLGK